MAEERQGLGPQSADQIANQLRARLVVAIEAWASTTTGGALREVSANTAVRLSDYIIEANAAGGAFTITYSPALAIGKIVWIVKAPADTSINAVNVSDGSTTVLSLTTPKSSVGVYSDGTNLAFV